MLEETEAQKLNSALLTDSDSDDEKERKPKRNSKEDFITKIHKVVDQYDLEFGISDETQTHDEKGLDQGISRRGGARCQT